MANEGITGSRPAISALRLEAKRAKLGTEILGEPLGDLWLELGSPAPDGLFRRVRGHVLGAIRAVLQDGLGVELHAEPVAEALGGAGQVEHEPLVADDRHLALLLELGDPAKPLLLPPDHLLQMLLAAAGSIAAQGPAAAGVVEGVDRDPAVSRVPEQNDQLVRWELAQRDLPR